MTFYFQKGISTQTPLHYKFCGKAQAKLELTYKVDKGRRWKVKKLSQLYSFPQTETP